MEEIAKIVEIFKCNDTYKILLSDLYEYNYERLYVNPMGKYAHPRLNDSESRYKYLVTYKIGIYEFAYHHILTTSSTSSIIDSSKFNISLGRTSNSIFTYRVFQEIIKPYNKLVLYDVSSDDPILSRFRNTYGLNLDAALYFFGILNSFSFGRCINMKVDTTTRTIIIAEQLFDTSLGYSRPSA